MIACCILIKLHLIRQVQSEGSDATILHLKSSQAAN